MIIINEKLILQIMYKFINNMIFLKFSNNMIYLFIFLVYEIVFRMN